MKIITVVQTFFRKSCRRGAIKGFQMCIRDSFTDDAHTLELVNRFLSGGDGESGE